MPRRTDGWCVECDVPQLARNNYFDMKLLVARDFTDEQRFFIGKDRRHNQRLHGWGTVCGLRVKPHPNPNCRQQYVVIEPGTAIDCCGREVLIEREQLFDVRTPFLAWWQAEHPDIAEPPKTAEHTLQVCLHYHECPTEDVPVLFDDCNCDGDTCQPNRVLESFDLSLRVDPPHAPAVPEGLRLRWSATTQIANARWMAYDEAQKRLYVLTSDAAALLHVYDAADGPLNERDLSPSSNPVVIGGRALDMTLAPDGRWLYLAIDKSGGQADIVAYDTTNFMAPRKTVATGISGAVNGLRILASNAGTAGGRLFALRTGTANQQLLAWDDPAGTPVDATGGTAKNVAAGPIGMGIASDGVDDWLIVAGATAVSMLKAANLGAITDVNYGVAGLAPAAMALAQTSDPLTLFVVDAPAKTVNVFGLKPGSATPIRSLGASPALTDTPVDIAATAGGRWAIVLTQDASGQGSVQAVDAHAIASGKPSDALGVSERTGSKPQHLLLVGNAARALATFEGAPGAGGVTVLDVEQDDCEDIFLKALDACPACPDDDCIVLATIADYHWDDKLEENRIDNISDRKLLPSTELIAEAVECLMARKGGPGSVGEQGKPGEPGKPGEGIDDVKVTFNPCVQGVHGVSSASVQVIAGKRTLVLSIAEGCDGADGADGAPGVGLEAGLTRIRALSWAHNTTAKLAAVRLSSGRTVPGMVIEFSDLVDVKSVDGRHVFQVAAEHPDASDNLRGMFVCRCPLVGRVIGVTVTGRNGDVITDAAEIGTPLVPAVAFLFDEEFKVLDRIRELLRRMEKPLEFWVSLRGDFVLDKQGRAIDAEYVRAQLMSGDRPAASPVGIQGGLFESWFTLEV
ncbi:MAG: hypothetical protein HZB53_06250 [Chloroflexi bacterium]|nr:hypothetical protein [Chloroflexota bacterium]